MRPTTVTLTGSGAGVTESAPIRVNWRGGINGIGMGFTTTGATTVFAVQYTYADPTEYATAALYNSGATWYTHSVMAGLVAAADGTITGPVQAIRLQASAAGTDTGSLTIIQSGPNT